MTLIKNDFESNLPGRNIMYFLKKQIEVIYCVYNI